jgi:hypothetical protein
MKHIIHFVEKYDDVAEALKTVLTLTVVTGAILGLAPMLIVLQTAF